MRCERFEKPSQSGTSEHANGRTNACNFMGRRASEERFRGGEGMKSWQMCGGIFSHWFSYFVSPFLPLIFHNSPHGTTQEMDTEWVDRPEFRDESIDAYI